MNEEVFIVTQRIEPYRFKFYELLSDKFNGNFVGIHSNDIPSNLKFRSIKLKKISAFNLHFQIDIFKIVCDCRPKTIVAEFDLHVISNLMLLFLCKLLNINFIWWGIGLGKKDIFYFLRKILIGLSNGIIVYEDLSKSKLIQIGVKNEKIGVMKNTVYVPNPSYNSDLSKKKNLLVIGKLDKRKGIDILLNSFGEVLDNLKNIEKIVIIGEGPEKDNLNKLCEILNIQHRVVFKGRVNDEEILKDEFHKSLATIHPHQAGLSVLHSFAYGVPFVTSSYSISGGEVENIENRVTGILYDGTIVQLTKIIMDIDSNPEKYHEMGFNAYRYYINSRTIFIMVENYFKSINSLII